MARFARRLLLVAAMFASLAAPSPVGAVETVTFHEPTPGGGRSGATRTATGRALARDSAGGMLLEADDGARYVIPGEDVLEATRDSREFTPLTVDALGERLLGELPDGFRVHTTEHYAVAYDTTSAYAKWAGSLLEGLQRAFLAYWQKQGLEVDEPGFPLGVVIHRSAEAYKAAAEAELGAGAAGAVGYYSLRTNRVRMFDLTGSAELRAAGGSNRRGSRRQIMQMLSLPAAEPLVATVVHEATHQVAFNTGLMQRYADLPLWLVEGMAVYFEAPNASSMRGWRGIGKVNRRRLATFQRNLPRWNAGSLTSLLATDDRLRDPRTGADAYADAWALTYYLIKKRRDAYVAYVGEMAERDPLRSGPDAGSGDAEARRRIALFTKHFGELGPLELDFLRSMRRL